jgi:hypothetical protein
MFQRVLATENNRKLRLHAEQALKRYEELGMKG